MPNARAAEPSSTTSSRDQSAPGVNRAVTPHCDPQRDHNRLRPSNVSTKACPIAGCRPPRLGPPRYPVCVARLKAWESNPQPADYESLPPIENQGNLDEFAGGVCKTRHRDAE
jgi:hypothetical protein